MLKWLFKLGWRVIRTLFTLLRFLLLKMDEKTKEEIRRLEEHISNNRKELEKKKTRVDSLRAKYEEYLGAKNEFMAGEMVADMKSTRKTIANINKLIESDIEEIARLRNAAASSSTGQQNGMLSQCEMRMNMILICVIYALVSFSD